MLPNLRFLICGVLFCFLLFAVAGAGIRLPDARTRIGEMPEIGRPMMQRSMADAPARAQFHMAAIARRTGELERLREQAAIESATEIAQPRPESDLRNSEPTPANPGEPAAPDDPAPDSVGEAVMAEDAEAPIPAPAAETARVDRPGETVAPQVAAAPPPSPDESPSADQQSVADGVESLPRLVNVPLPPPRPAFLGFHRRAHLFHRRHRVIVVVRDMPAQGAPAQGAPGQGAQGAVVQGWPPQSVTASTSTAEAGKR